MTRASRTQILACKYDHFDHNQEPQDIWLEERLRLETIYYNSLRCLEVRDRSESALINLWNLYLDPDSSDFLLLLKPATRSLVDLGTKRTQETIDCSRLPARLRLISTLYGQFCKTKQHTDIDKYAKKHPSMINIDWGNPSSQVDVPVKSGWSIQV